MRKLAYICVISAALLCSTAQADLLDLTTPNATDSATAVIGGTFRVDQIDPQSTGTGVIDSFLRLQASGNNDFERGYNTDANPEYDAKAGNFTRALQLFEVPIVNLGGTDYRQFLLDVNQNTGGDSEFISLNQIQIFRAAADVGNSNETLTDAVAGTNALISFASATEVFRMNNSLATDPATTSNHRIQLDYSLNAGSGSGDMFLYVPQTAFAAAANTDYIVFFSQFGTPPGNFETNDGVEEWAVLQGSSTVIPEPSSIALLASVIAAVGLKIRTARKA